MSVTISPKPATEVLVRKRNAKKRAYLAAFVRTCSVTGAARAAGVAPARHYEWMRADPEYKAAYEAVQNQAAQTLEDEAVRRAYEGVERAVTVAGKREIVCQYSDTLLIFLLKGLRPAKYRERYDVAVEAGESLVQAMARGRERALAARQTIDARPEE